MSWEIENISREFDITFLRRFVDLSAIVVSRPVQDVERFLDVLKNLDIVQLTFTCIQPQELFDGLPKHCAVQQMFLNYPNALADYSFLPRLSELYHLYVASIDAETIRSCLEQLQLLKSFTFTYLGKWNRIEIQTVGRSKRFKVTDSNNYTGVIFNDLNAALKFIMDFYDNLNRKKIFSR